MIYIIGDSHVSVFSGTDTTVDGYRHIQPEFGTCYTLTQGQLKPIINKFEQRIPYFMPIKIGSHTAYNSFNKLSKIEQVITEYKITKNDYIFLCFGQIDVQYHIVQNSLKKSVSIDNTITECVDRYIQTALFLKNKYSDIKIGIYSAPPTSNIYSIIPNISMDKSKEYVNITLSFNNILKNKCNTYNLLYKDICSKLILPTGLINIDFVMDDVHLSQKAVPLLIEEFKDIII
jgi:hypothetical protein